MHGISAYRGSRGGGVLLLCDSHHMSPFTWLGPYRRQNVIHFSGLRQGSRRCSWCGAQDWCISRQLWWGHPIPVWYVFPDEAAADAAPGGVSDEYVVARNESEALTQAQERCAHVSNPQTPVVCPRSTSLHGTSRRLLPSLPVPGHRGTGNGGGGVQVR